MNSFTEAAVTVASLIVGVAALSVLVSRNSNTAAVIQASASGFTNSLLAAMTPVNGNAPSVNNSYPSAVNQGFGLPQLGFGQPANS